MSTEGMYSSSDKCLLPLPSIKHKIEITMHKIFQPTHSSVLPLLIMRINRHNIQIIIVIIIAVPLFQI